MLSEATKADGNSYPRRDACLTLQRTFPFSLQLRRYKVPQMTSLHENCVSDRRLHRNAPRLCHEGLREFSHYRPWMVLFPPRFPLVRSAAFPLGVLVDVETFEVSPPADNQNNQRRTATSTLYVPNGKRRHLPRLLNKG